MSTEISLHLMALVFVVFLATLYLLNIWLFKPLILFMEKRDESINQDVQEIKDSANEVELITKEIGEILDGARAEAKHMIENASTEAKSVYDAKMARYKAENQTKFEDFLKGLESERVELKNALIGNKALFQNALKSKIKEI
ncbi:F0F1 ATP synthase subunit B' [Helicobacter anseris]|uniref:F0F1 ATP synthase subunit B n=1 Tax=Helicobacter anseris TaxID=375926 RepID=A0A3D8JB29_9HELI|nr:F0F1 ATP synthase subunit B' [Helicobacter anseris]RDU74658.1 F0F1 ATP synthase subunit B' [Helicobacter anseris]